MKSKNLSIVLGIFLVVLLNSIIYGALNTNMFIDGDAYVRIDKNIRVTGIKVIEQKNGAYETYNCDYSKNTTSIQVTLPSSDSSIVYEVTITNKGDIDYEVSNIVEESYSNNNIKYEIIDLEKGTVIDGETTYVFKIKLTTTENNSENKGTLVLKYTFEEWVPSLYNMVAHKSRSLDTDVDFGVAPTKETSGVYEMESTKDDEYPVYYYRGIIDNNNVNFAGFCWKAVRTTSTGGVKLIYNGVVAEDGSCDNTGEASQIGTSVFNTSDTLASDISYVYDNGSDSTIKGVIDKWYSDNMVEYTGMLEDTVWCNDRSISSTNGSVTYFGAYDRVINSNPSILCSNYNDKLTIKSGKLKYSIALLTVDEIILAGHGIMQEGASVGYLNTGQVWWSLSPSDFFNPFAYELAMYGNGRLQDYRVVNSLGVRPSISLANRTMIKEGNGSVFKPYKLIEDKIQKEWTFDYTGEEQEFKVPYDGVYRLETWGAQGGNDGPTNGPESYGGYGSYSVGEIYLKSRTFIYINVGSRGNTYQAPVDSYNGGGIASTGSGAGGGGASHISTSSKGNLENFQEYQSELLLVAGGGGGAGDRAAGGSAGGISGVNGYGTNPGLGATQDSGYAFGKGENGLGQNAAGGGGYYGGRRSNGGALGGGGGGSGYIGNPLLNDKMMYCYNCQESKDESTKTISTTNVSEEPISNYAKIGNGYAKITLISKK